MKKKNILLNVVGDLIQGSNYPDGVTFCDQPVITAKNQLYCLFSLGFLSIDIETGNLLTKMTGSPTTRISRKSSKSIEKKNEQGFDLFISAIPDKRELETLLKDLEAYDPEDVKVLKQKLKEKLAWLETLSPLAVLLLKLGLEFKPRIEKESAFIDRSEKLGRYALAYRITIPEEYRDLRVFIPCEKHTDAGIGMETTAACPLAQLESGLLVDPSLAEAAKLEYRPVPLGRRLCCQFWDDQN
jgi:hypothetical protein